MIYHLPRLANASLEKSPRTEMSSTEFWYNSQGNFPKKNWIHQRQNFAYFKRPNCRGYFRFLKDIFPFKIGYFLIELRPKEWPNSIDSTQMSPTVIQSSLNLNISLFFWQQSSKSAPILRINFALFDGSFSPPSTFVSKNIWKQHSYSQWNSAIWRIISSGRSVLPSPPCWWPSILANVLANSLAYIPSHFLVFARRISGSAQTKKTRNKSLIPVP